MLIERFNGTYRREVLNAHLFMDFNQVRDQTQQWIWDYNNVRPHESLGNKPPVVFVKQKDNYSLPILCIDNHLLKETIFAIASDYGSLTEARNLCLIMTCR
ncbi:MAG: transposase [Cytophagales bacterium]|nr:transposase [Cytophagales bacterium]